MVTSALLFSLATLLLSSTTAGASSHGGNHVGGRRHHAAISRMVHHDSVVPHKRSGGVKRRCAPRAGKGQQLAAASATSSETTPTTTKASTESASESTAQQSSGGESAPDAGEGKPADWPSETQKGAAPAATRTSSSDPFLLELSKSYNNKGNQLYTEKKSGKMTYYGQSLGACGDTYDDNSFTAAVSQHLYDAWPGATEAQNLNPICGPFVPGRKTLSMSGIFETASKGRGDGKNFANIGGDGAINCDAVSQCHIPLTATVKHGGKTINVKIVDRCVGCAEGDIDLTPAAFKALADPALGRTDVEWWFNQY